MKKITWMFTFAKLIAVITLFSFFASCGGGGGGAASGPAAPGSETPDSPSSEPVVAIAPKDITTPESFAFKKAENAALSSCDLDSYDGIIDEANATITLSLPFGTDKSNLIPEIKLPTDAVINPASGVAQDFTNSVIYKVTAADKTTEKDWTVNVTILPDDVYNVNYDLDGGKWIIAQPENSFNKSDSITLPVRGNLAKENYIFKCWHEGSENGNVITGWNANEKTNSVALFAEWELAPSVNTTGKEIYANGFNLVISTEFSGTTVFVDKNGDGLKNDTEPTLYEINNNYPANGADLSGYTIYGGNNSVVTSPQVISTNLLFKGGKVANVHGGNKNGSLPAGLRKVTVKDSAIIGDTSKNGVYLRTLTDNKVLVDNLNESAKIALIGSDVSVRAGVSVATSLIGAPRRANFAVKNESLRSFDINVDGQDLKVIGKIDLPDADYIQWHGDTFTVGTGNVTTGGTIFSLFAGGGYFTVTQDTLSGAEFDMGIPLKDDKITEDDYTSVLSKDKMYRYIQFTSENGEINSQNADEFLSNVVFHKGVSNNVTVRINLETVSLNEIRAAGVTYFNGSFYKACPEHLSWTEAYNKAKKQKFNNLVGYLMTITSQAENNFIYDKLFATGGVSGTAWLGATRTENTAGGYDAATWTHGADHDSWEWVCGPEAGQKFFTRKNSAGTVVSGWYANWYSGEPNATYQGIYGVEKCAQYCGTSSPSTAKYKYKWNDLTDVGDQNKNNEQWYVNYYVVEFTPYGEGKYNATHAALTAEKTY